MAKVLASASMAAVKGNNISIANLKAEQVTFGLRTVDEAPKMTSSPRLAHIAAKAAKLMHKEDITLEEIRELGASVLSQTPDTSTRLRGAEELGATQDTWTRLGAAEQLKEATAEIAIVAGGVVRRARSRRK